MTRRPSFFLGPREKRPAAGSIDVSMNALATPEAATVLLNCFHLSAPTSNLVILALMVALVLGTAAVPVPARAQFTITVFRAANNVTFKDEDGDKSDWIEIQNQGLVTSSRVGWFLTDTTNNPAKWQFPTTKLTPSGFASGNNRRIASPQFQTQ